MKLTWLNACGDGAGHMQFQGTKKGPAKGEELNGLMENVVKDFLK